VRHEKGCEIVCLGDWTNDVGEVIEATEQLSHLGVAVALEGYSGSCPKCGGVLLGRPLGTDRRPRPALIPVLALAGVRARINHVPTVSGLLVGKSSDGGVLYHPRAPFLVATPRHNADHACGQ
jgi:hypothetical protein